MRRADLQIPFPDSRLDFDVVRAILHRRDLHAIEPCLHGQRDAEIGVTAGDFRPFPFLKKSSGGRIVELPADHGRLVELEAQPDGSAFGHRLYDAHLVISYITTQDTDP